VKKLQDCVVTLPLHSFSLPVTTAGFCNCKFYHHNLHDILYRLLNNPLTMKEMRFDPLHKQYPNQYYHSRMWKYHPLFTRTVIKHPIDYTFELTLGCDVRLMDGRLAQLAGIYYKQHWVEDMDVRTTICDLRLYIFANHYTNPGGNIIKKSITSTTTNQQQNINGIEIYLTDEILEAQTIDIIEPINITICLTKLQFVQEREKTKKTII
jgi:hypothetical protein